MFPDTPFTEFFCGIGGLSCCMNPIAGSDEPKPSRRSVAIDINQNALAVHRLNFSNDHHEVVTATIESLKPEQLSQFPNRLWWMSPPCQPYTRRGRQRDWDDPRTAALRNMIRLIGELRPDNLAMENVPEFAQSESRNRLIDRLQECGYQFAETVLCPSEFSVPNRRRRYYLVASQDGAEPWRTPEPLPVAEFDGIRNRLRQPLLDRDKWAANHIDRFKEAVDIVSLNGLLTGNEISSCFTSAYGRSPVRSGSYLRDAQGVRFFSPGEILGLLGFPPDFQLPDWPARKLWPLVGNTLSLPVVRFVLSHLPI